MKEKTTKVCPICGSAKLYYEVGGKIGFVYHCKNCGYIGSFIIEANEEMVKACLLYTSPSPRDRTRSRMPSSA